MGSSESKQESQEGTKHEVVLVASELGGGAYHTSVCVDGEEFSFSDGGISVSRYMESHAPMKKDGKEPVVTKMGKTDRGASMMLSVLQGTFSAGTYDLLKKNCNSFSDCACWFLLRKRIPNSYRRLDSWGSNVQGLVAGFSGGQYTPNPKAASYDHEKAIAAIDPDKHFQSTGYAVGGRAGAQTAEDLRKARLQKFEGGGTTL